MIGWTLDGESATKDKDRSEISNSLNTLFICIKEYVTLALGITRTDM